VDIANGIAAGKALLDVAKLVTDMVNSPNPDVVAVRSKIHEMLIHAVNAQMALGEARVEITTLQQQLDDRLVFKTLQADMEFRLDGSFFIRSSEASRGLIAYCPICWEVDRKAVPMKSSEGMSCFNCPVHKTFYETQEYRQKRLERRGTTVRRQPRSGHR
jgi:hypothetical protein